MVVRNARSAVKRYGTKADVRVITFYNMQKRDLEREFKKHRDISHVPIASVRNTSKISADFNGTGTQRSTRQNGTHPFTALPRDVKLFRLTIT